MERKEIIEKVIRNWAEELGLPSDFCKVYEKALTGRVNGVSSIELKFKEQSLNQKVLNGGAKVFGCLTVPRYLEENTEKFLMDSSLYLFAYKYGELHMINRVIDSGDHFYVMLNGGNKESHLMKLLEVTKATCNHGIYSIKKEALTAYYMFYDGNI